MSKRLVIAIDLLCTLLLCMAGGGISSAYAEEPPVPLVLPVPPAGPASAEAAPPPPPPTATAAPAVPEAAVAADSSATGQPAAAVPPAPAIQAEAQPDAKAPEPVPSAAQANPVPVPTPTSAAPAASSDPADKDKAASDSKKETEEKVAEKVVPGWKGSLMFLPADLKAIAEAQKDAENAASGIEITKPEEGSVKSFIPNLMANLAPTYYLNSILYVSADNWAIWVNGIQYSSKTRRFASEALEGLQVESVSQQVVRFKAKVRLLDRISPDWQLKFAENAEGDFIGREINNLIISKNKDTIRFSLQPNQHLALSTMTIIEGAQ